MIIEYAVLIKIDLLIEKIPSLLAGKTLSFNVWRMYISIPNPILINHAENIISGMMMGNYIKGLS